MDLPVFEQHRTGQVPRANSHLRRRKLGVDAFRAGADADRPAPLFIFGDPDPDALTAEQACGGLRDLLQRPLGIARRAGDGAQDFGAAGLAIPGGAQFGQQPGVFPREISHNIRGKRGHSLKSISPGGPGLNNKHACPGSQFKYRLVSRGIRLFNRPVSDYSIPDASGPAPSGHFFR